MEDREKPKLTIEDYLRFLEEPDSRCFTLHQLNQIVMMHGFAKIMRDKKAIVETLEAVDLMRPMRSTLKNRETYPCAELSLDEVRADIATIRWQECPIGSVSAVTVRPSGSAADKAATASVTDLICQATTSNAVSGKKRQNRRTSAACISATDLICPSTSSSATACKKKRKRKTTAAVPLQLALVDV